MNGICAMSWVRRIACRLCKRTGGVYRSTFESALRLIPMPSISTFYTRDDLVDISKAGLNTLRIPLGYWAVDLQDYEPYVSGQVRLPTTL